MTVASRPVSNMSANTSFAIRPEIVPSEIKPTSAPNAIGLTGLSDNDFPALFNAPNNSTLIQFATSFLSRPSLALS